MCYKAEFWRRYRLRWTEDKLSAAEHALANAEAELARHRKFIAEENRKRSKGILSRWLKTEMGHA